jgi:hypothetical protein
MPKANYWVNDNLAKGFGRRTVDNGNAATVRTAGAVKQLVLEIGDLTTLTSSIDTTVVAGSKNNSATIPAGAFIKEVTIIATTAATGTGATLLLGVYTIDADGTLTAVDADGLAAGADTPLSGLNAIGDSITLGIGSTAALVGEGTVGPNPVVVAAINGGTAYTAGAVKIVIDYIPA